MLTKRSTVYFDPAIHRALKLMAIEIEKSISDIINEVIRYELAQDQEDLEAFTKREDEPTTPYETLLKKLKADGKI